MKEYLRPEAVVVDFAAEAVTDGITDTTSGFGIEDISL